MTQIRGIDVSGWQHPPPEYPPIDWDHVASAGYRFAIVKCTQGTTYTNPHLTEDVLGAHKAGLAVGCYHYGWPIPGGALAEAAYALKATDHLPLDLGITYDLEELGEFQYHSELREYATQFLHQISQQHEDAPLYTYRDFLNSMGGAVVNHKLWLALGSDTIPEPVAGTPVWCYQLSAKDVPGVDNGAALCDTNQMVSARGLNPPKKPGPVPITPPEVETSAEETTPEELHEDTGG